MTSVKPPEWDSVVQSVQTSREQNLSLWQVVSRAPQLTFFTDGSAPEENPGGAIGFAAIAVGDGKRLDLAGRVPARRTEPPTSNNRAEIAGVLASLEAIRLLSQEDGAVRGPVTVWCDSQYVVKCANGLFKRHKNQDLWSLYDGLRTRLRPPAGPRVEIRWTRGHVGTELNEEADRLARAAALGEPLEPPVQPEREPDYRISLLTRKEGSRSRGAYLLQTRTGRSRAGEVELAAATHPDEAEYRTLIAVLEDLQARVRGASRTPEEFHLLVRSSRELVVRQLNGEYRVRSKTLLPVYQEARGLLEPWGGARFEQVPGESLAAEIGA